MRDRRAYFKEWYAKNRERVIAKSRAWELANPERAAEKKREYCERHPDRRKESQRKHYMKPEVKARYRESERRRAYAKVRNARDAAELTDTFVRRCMAQYMTITGSQIPQPLVDAYREVMKIRRELNAKR